MKKINFDVNATEKPTKKTLQVLKKIYKKGYYNPSSTYSGGRETKELIEQAREEVSVALNCYPDEIFFTSGASESNSWIQLQYLLDIDNRSHHSLVRDNISSKITRRFKAIPLVVSETGQLLSREYNLYEKDKTQPLFVDLTQAIGRVKIDLKEMENIAFASASGHKFGSILGCGILYVRREYQNNLLPLINGTQERGLRGGTENVPAIICFGKAILEATNNMEENNKKADKVLNCLYNELSDYCFYYKPDVVINMGDINVINITFSELSAASAVELFSNYGIYISAGSACNSVSEEPSEAYLESGYTREEALRTIRISVDSNNTIREAKKFFKVFKNIVDNYDF